MTHALLDDHKKWRDELIYHLRMTDVPGDRIGDILLEAEAHIQESGETPDEAFGTPKEYASSRAIDAVRDKPSIGRLAAIALMSGLGSFVYVYGATGIGEGVDSVTALHLSPWLLVVAGLAILTFMLWTLPIDLVRHPVTNKPLFGGSETNAKPVVFGVIIAIGLLFALFGRLLAG